MEEKQEKKTILVVDDDITTLTALRGILEKTYDVCLAKSADAAWYILNNAQMDLILLDIEMPNMTGLVFMDYLKENNAFYYYFVPVIFVTSHGTPDVIMQAKRSGAKGFIVKPVAPDVLMEKIKQLLEASSEKSVRNTLLQLLHQLDLACKVGKSSEVEKIAGELKLIQYNVGTDQQIAEICKSALLFDFSIAMEKISNLLKNNLFDKKA
jgi:DNA-binding NtrC family response regulator